MEKGETSSHVSKARPSAPKSEIVIDDPGTTPFFNWTAKCRFDCVQKCDLLSSSALSAAAYLNHRALQSAAQPKPRRQSVPGPSFHLPQAPSEEIPQTAHRAPGQLARLDVHPRGVGEHVPLHLPRPLLSFHLLLIRWIDPYLAVECSQMLGLRILDRIALPGANEALGA
jgi:hypothetical protein